MCVFIVLYGLLVAFDWTFWLLAAAYILRPLYDDPQRETRDEVRALREELRAERERQGITYG